MSCQRWMFHRLSDFLTLELQMSSQKCTKFSKTNGEAGDAERKCDVMESRAMRGIWRACVEWQGRGRDEGRQRHGAQARGPACRARHARRTGPSGPTEQRDHGAPARPPAACDNCSALALARARAMAADFTPAPADPLALALTHPYGLSVALSPSKGRCLLALRPFPRGALIFHQAPYVATLAAPSLASRCDCCYHSSSPLLRCSACKTVFYCSADCQVPTPPPPPPWFLHLLPPTSPLTPSRFVSQRQEWGHHKFECAILVRLFKEKQRTPTSTMRLVLRLLIKRRLQADQVNVSLLSLPSLYPFAHIFSSLCPWSIMPESSSLNRFRRRLPSIIIKFVRLCLHVSSSDAFSALSKSYIIPRFRLQQSGTILNVQPSHTI